MSNGDYLVEVTYNDTPVILGGCTASPCKASDFANYLGTVVASTGGKQVSEVCASAPAQKTDSKFLVQ